MRFEIRTGSSTAPAPGGVSYQSLHGGSVKGFGNKKEEPIPNGKPDIKLFGKPAMNKQDNGNQNSGNSGGPFSLMNRNETSGELRRLEDEIQKRRQSEEKPIGNGTESIKPENFRKLWPDELETTPSREFQNSFDDVNGERSASMKLIDDSAKLLYGFMDSLKKEPVNGETIRSACSCAKELTNLLRLKMDAIRFKR